MDGHWQFREWRQTARPSRPCVLWGVLGREGTREGRMGSRLSAGRPKASRAVHARAAAHASDRGVPRFREQGLRSLGGRTVKVFSGAKLKLGTHSVMSEQPSAPKTTAGHRHVKSSHGAATLALGPAGGPTTTHRRSRHSRGNGCGRSRWWPASGCRPAHGRGAPTVRLRSALLTRAGRDAAAAGGAPCRRCGSPASPPCRGSPSTP